MKQPQPSALNCFVCGVENKYGLNIHFYETSPVEVVADVTVPEQFQGYPGIVHGGIIAAMLDEVASRTFFRGDPPRLVVTGKLNVRYRKPVPVNVPLKLIGRVLQDKGKICTASGQILGQDGERLAEAEVTLFEVSPEFFAGFPSLDDQGWKVYDDPNSPANEVQHDH